MTVHYADEDEARQVINALRRVAREIKMPEPLHVADYLDVDPGAPYVNWKQAFKQRQREANVAKEGTADARVKLCQRLAKDFSDEPGWRGLLNRLGRMEIEGQVIALARRGARPEALRNRFVADVHTLEEVVGAPDAEELAQELYLANGLGLPAAAPETQAIAPPPEPPDVPVVPDREPEQNLLGTLGGMFLRAAAQWADEKIDRRRQLMDERLDVSGAWQSPDGSVFNFAQQGLNVSVEGFASGVPMQGSGQLRGTSLQLSGFSPVGGPFRATIMVSADGRLMQGQAVDGYGRVTPVRLHR